MKKLFNTIQNIFKIQELKDRILLTLGLLVVYRIGSFIVLPGVDSLKLEELTQNTSGIAALLNIFAGGAFSRASIFALGIMPYISASIVMQLLGIVIPSVQKMQKEGESGRRKINQYTRILTILITLGQAPSYLITQIPSEAILNYGFWSFTFPAVLILTTGTMFVMWLGEKITDRGIGNGISLLIMVGIISRLPTAFLFEFDKQMGIEGFGLIFILIELVILLVVTIFTVLLIQGVRKIPVHFAKKIMTNNNLEQEDAARQYIPLKVNSAGVMPIIFAQTIMFAPVSLFGLFESDLAITIANKLSDITGFWYNFVFSILIIVFTYVYTAMTINPQQMADDLKRSGGFVPGQKPGIDTSNYFDKILSKITLPGSIFLAIIAILPAFIVMTGVSQGFSYFFGGTSLLIMVGVILDTLQQIESYLLMRHYDGLMKTGKIKGRNLI